MNDENSALRGLKERIKRDLERDGWSCISVFPTPEDPGVYFSYSVGLREHNQPEVIVLGLPPDFGHQIINNVYDKVKNNGLVLEDGLFLDEVLDGYQVWLRAVPSDGAPLNVAKMYYEVDKLAALQIVWPDEAGNFPGDDACDPSVVKEQDLNELRDSDAEATRKDFRKILERAHTRVTQHDMPSFFANGRAESPGLGMSLSLPHHEGKITEGNELLELFRNWSGAEILDLERFWQDFEISADAIKEFSQMTGQGLGAAPPVLGLMITFGAALAKSRYKPTGLPEITI